MSQTILTEYGQTQSIVFLHVEVSSMQGYVRDLPFMFGLLVLGSRASKSTRYEVGPQNTRKVWGRCHVMHRISSRRQLARGQKLPD
jgi:hypothetical protein